MPWGLTWSAGTTRADLAANFLRTTDRQPLSIRTNGAECLRIADDGVIRSGAAPPTSLLVIEVPGSSGPISALSMEVRTFGAVPNALASRYLRGRYSGNVQTPFDVRGDRSVGAGTGGPGGGPDVVGDIRARDVILASDPRLKADASPVTRLLDRLERVRAMAYSWSDPAVLPHRTGPYGNVGAPAQVVEGVFVGPADAHRADARTGDHCYGLTAVLVEACKELEEQDHGLRLRADALEDVRAGGPDRRRPARGGRRRLRARRPALPRRRTP
jgi:hypothetical protein